MPTKSPPTHKTVRRTWGDNQPDAMPRSKAAAQALAALADFVKPKRVAQDVELPNPDGWKGVDPRIKKLKGF